MYGGICMVLLDRKALFLISTIIFAIVLCGAASASTSTETSNKSLVSSVQGKDLVLTSVTASSITAKGQKIIIKSTIKNQGNKAVTNGFYTYFYMVPSKSLAGAKTYLGKQYFSSIPALATRTQISSYIVPNSINSGSYYIAAKTDATWKVKEVNEGNNVGFTTSKTNVYLKKIDSGVGNSQYYKNFSWITYQINNYDLVIYSRFYNPDYQDANYNPSPRMMSQKTIIGKFYGVGFTIFYTLAPKITGRSSYWNGLGYWSSPLQFYWTYFRPDMKANGPNH